MINPQASLTPRERTALRRRLALLRKYAKAVELYDTTQLALGEIARRCGVSAGALGNYLRCHWRELVLRRHNMAAPGADPQAVRLLQAGGQSPAAHEKYREAVAACDSMDFIELNLSQVARKFGLGATALTNFMRVHYPGTLARREESRRRLGLADGGGHGARRACARQYAEAVNLYASTSMTVAEVARRCGVSEGGLSQHLRFYHHDVLQAKRQQRSQARGHGGEGQQGRLLGNGQRYEPSARSEAMYAEALALFRSTSLTLKEIAARTGVHYESLRNYLRRWHRPLMLQRRGKKQGNAADGQQGGSKKQVRPCSTFQS